MGVEGEKAGVLELLCVDKLISYCGLQTRGDEGDAWDCESKLGGGYEDIEQDLATTAKCSPDNERVGVALQLLAALDQFEGADSTKPPSEDKGNWREDESTISKGFGRKQYTCSTVSFNQRNVC